MTLTRTRRLLDATADPLLALALLGLGVYEIWIESGQVAGPRAGNTAFLVFVTVPLAWRRRYPLAVLTLVTLGAIGWVSAWYFEQQPPFVPFVALLLCVFAVAATATGRAVTAGAGLLAAFVVTDLAAVVLGGRPEETGAGWILLALTWALGRVVHRQRALAAALAERASQLEREREEKARLAVALERARIARELHDVVTHNVSVMVVQTGVERRLLGEGPGSTREVLRAVEQTGRETLVELRRLLGVLRKGDERLTLAPQPSLGRLDELIENIGEPVSPSTCGSRAGARSCRQAWSSPLTGSCRKRLRTPSGTRTPRGRRFSSAMAPRRWRSRSPTTAVARPTELSAGTGSSACASGPRSTAGCSRRARAAAAATPSVLACPSSAHERPRPHRRRSGARPRRLPPAARV